MRHVAKVWEEFHSASDTLRSGLGGRNAVTSVMCRCASKVSPIDAVHCPGCATIWCFVNEHFGAGRREWSLVVIEGSV